MGRPKKNISTSTAVAPKKISSIEGLMDVITETSNLSESVVRSLQRMSGIYGFSHVEVPLLEDWHLYNNFYGQDRKKIDQLVSAEINGSTATIRPSLIPGVLRSYAQHKIFDKTPLSKWSYSGMTVKQNPESKNLVGDYEFGFEVFGNFSHLTEAQVIGVVWELFKSLGLENVVLEINNIGKAECQKNYEETLKDFLMSKKYELCDNCNEHLHGRVLNVFRCDNIECQTILSEVPAILDFLDQESHKHFTNILEALDELSIPYQLNPLFVGPEGASKTNIIMKYKHKGQIVVVGEGGYHDSALHAVSGKNYSCFGFNGSFITLQEILMGEKPDSEKEIKNDVFLVPLGELAAKKSLKLFRDLTNQQVSVYDHFGNLGVKNQLKAAETYKAPIALIIGQKEAMDEMVILRDVKSGMQEIISYDKIVEEVKKRLGR